MENEVIAAFKHDLERLYPLHVEERKRIAEEAGRAQAESIELTTKLDDLDIDSFLEERASRYKALFPSVRSSELCGSTACEQSLLRRCRMRGIRVTDEDKRMFKQLDLNRFVQEQLGLKPKGRSGSITYYLSPLREESKPSFTVEYYRSEWRWRDWGGDETDRGDIIELVERVYSVDFPEALRILL